MDGRHMSEKKDMVYAISANFLSTLVSAIITLLLPKQISVEEYGYFQYYLFWAGYLGIFHLGWIDGLYLVHCGDYYDNLDKKRISRQLRSFSIFQFILGVLIIVYALFFESNPDHRVVFICIGVLLSITNTRLMLLYILQATARIKEYSISTIGGLGIYLLMIVVLMILKIKKYEYYVMANIISIAAPMVMAAFYCKNIVTEKPVIVKESIQDTIEYIRVGSKLLIANYASAWIIGIVRFLIEKKWDISTFAKISLTITISNLFMSLINAIALVLLPMLRRMDNKRLFRLYDNLNTVLLTALFGGMILYYPVERILLFWLPEYRDGLIYMALLFPICVFESKNALILNTYLKALRKEKIIMLINIIIVILNGIMSGIAVFYFNSIALAMLCIVIALAIRCVLFEAYLSSQLHVFVKQDIITELAMSAAFITCNWMVGGGNGLLFYIALFAAYLIINRKRIILSYSTIMNK